MSAAWRRIFLAAIGAVGIAVPASAVQLHYDFTATSMLDDNLFRLAAANRDLLGRDAKDWVNQASALIGLDQQWSNWDLSASAMAERTWFKHNDFLNNTGYDLEGELSRKGDRSSIDLTAGSRRQLSSFNDIHTIARNVQSITNVRGELTEEIAGRMRLIGAAAFAQSTNSSDLIALSDYRRWTFTGGLGYYSPTGSILALQGEVRRSNGLSDRAALVGNNLIAYRADYTDKSINLRALYTPSVVWQLDSKIGYTWHKDRSGIASDFSGITGNANVRWSPLRSLVVNLKASRAFENTSGLFANGIKESHASVGVQNMITKSVAVQVSAERIWRTYRYDLSGNDTLSGHKERLNRLNANLSYEWNSHITLAGLISHQKRTSASSAYRFSETMGSLALSVNLGQQPPPNP